VYRACVFDLDGTLLDSYAGIREALCGTLATFGRPPVTLEETRRLVGRGLPKLIESTFERKDVEAAIRVFRERYAECGPRGTTLMPGADAVTADLARRGVVLLAASNKPSDFSRQILAALGVSERFALVSGPDQGFPPKPDPAMVLEGLGRLGIAPQEALFVGDMVIDVLTAKAAGMPVAVVPTGSSTLEELLAEDPEFVLRNLQELPALFGRRDDPSLPPFS
jgi:2-phosphoglycolate phosphatase